MSTPTLEFPSYLPAGGDAVLAIALAGRADRTHHLRAAPSTLPSATSTSLVCHIEWVKGVDFMDRLQER